MASNISVPKIKRIIKCTEWDQLRTKITEGNMYLCTDSLIMYYDETSSTRSVYAYTGVKTVNDMTYRLTPEYRS